MKKMETYQGVEQGPIRPPSEANSLLIRITRNCPWNQCTFCAVYKGAKFSVRPVEHVLKDIDLIRDYVACILEAREAGESLNDRLAQMPTYDMNAMHAAYQFVAGGMRSIFLQDGNSLIIKPDDLITILKHLQQSFPMIERITSYARSHTIARIKDEKILEMKEAGLNRIHIGMETGADVVLKKIKKGVDKATHVLAGQKVKKAGIQLSEYYMPGIGGKAHSREHALESADTLNQINPDYIRLRSLALPPSAPLSEEARAGNFEKLGEVDTAHELLLFLQTLDGITSTVRSDHILNLFPEVDGKLPEEKEKMIAPVRGFLELPPEEQLLFCVGRRTHKISRYGELKSPRQRKYAEQIVEELGATVENMDEVINTIMKRFV